MAKRQIRLPGASEAFTLARLGMRLQLVGAPTFHVTDGPMSSGKRKMPGLARRSDAAHLELELG